MPDDDEAEENVDKADSALEEADELVVGEEDEDQVEDDPCVDDEESDNAALEGNLEADSEGEGEYCEDKVGNSCGRVVSVLMKVESHLSIF